MSQSLEDVSQRQNSLGNGIIAVCCPDGLAIVVIFFLSLSYLYHDFVDTRQTIHVSKSSLG